MADLIATERSNIVAIADAVRGKTGSTENMTIGGIISGIESIEGGINLPELTTPATASEVFSGKEVIDEDGNVVTGTFSINSELNTQDSLITQIQNAVNELPDAGSGSTKNTVTVYVTPNDNIVYYFDTDKNQQSISNSASPITIEALSGVLFARKYLYVNCTGNYIQFRASVEPICIFLEDGGTIIWRDPGGAGA